MIDDGGVKPPLHKDAEKSGGGLGAKDALEARAGELDTHELFSSGLGIANVDYAAVSGEVCLVHSGTRKTIPVCGAPEGFGLAAARAELRQGDADFEVGTDGDVETRHEGGAVAAEIFAGSVFFEGKTVGVEAANFERQADGDSTFRALLRNGGARERDHGLGPRFWRLRLGRGRHFP